MENVCRLCWQQAYDLSTVFQFKNTHLVADLITEIVPEITIQRNDLLPKLICRNCLDIIVNACELKALSIKNDVKMRALVDVKQPIEFIIKDEPNPESVVQMDEINDQEQGTESFNTRFQLREFSVKLERISDTELVTLKEELDEVKVQTKTNTIQCTRCERSFTKKHKYERHIDFDHDSNYERYFKCDICWINGGFKLFKLKKNIEIHMEAFHMSNEVVKAKRKVKIANRVEEFECEHCKQQFGTRFGLYRHKKKIHQKDIPYFPCTMCHLWYMKKSRLDRHMKRHNEMAKKCKDCNLEFKTKGDLKLHNYIHCDYVEEYVEPGPHKLSCSLCAYQSYSDEDIQSHLPTHQSDFDSGKLLVCVKCSWTFNDYTFLADHTNEHNLKPTHRCLKCSRVYSYGKKLLRHLMRYQTSFCCDFCGHMEIKKPRLEEHIRFVHKKEVCHLCTICGETKPTSHALSSHMQVKHETEKKYKCSLCPKSFRTPAYYRNHQSVHTTEATFQCEKCPKKFKGYRNLKRHQKFHDPSKLVYRHACEFCDKKFYSNYALKRHILSHTGIKPYSCDVEGCDRAFSQSNDLHNHLRQHFGDNIHRCDHPGCSMRFKLKSEIRAHASIHYQEVQAAEKVGC